jgi:ABC-type phosphate transport system substrate-binding protein
MKPFRPGRSALALVMVALATVSLARADQPKPAYQIICNPSNPTASAERQFVVDAFLKKIKTWPGGDILRPVDLPPTSPQRRQFTSDIMRRPVEAVRDYWQQRIFAGIDLPPTELDNDDEVIRFVLKNRGAIGYVSTAAPLNGAKILILK